MEDEATIEEVEFTAEQKESLKKHSEVKEIKSPISALGLEKESERKADPAELRVASNTDSVKLAGAIFAKFREYGYVKLRCIGNGAIGSAFKAYVIASGYLQQNDVEVICKGAFFQVLLDGGQERDGVVINLDVR